MQAIWSIVILQKDYKTFFGFLRHYFSAVLKTQRL